MKALFHFFMILLCVTLLSSNIRAQTFFGQEQVLQDDLADYGGNKIAAGDIDGDGHVDIVGGTFRNVGGTDYIFWYKNDGNGSFGTGTIVNNSSDIIVELELIDIDGDDDLDIFYVSNYTDELGWHRNDGSGNFSGPLLISNEAVKPRSSYMSDLDNDGDLDIVSLSNYTFPESLTAIVWFENDGNQNFGSANQIESGLDLAWMVYTRDFDNDGDEDLLVVSSEDDLVAWYPNDGNGNFGPQQNLSHTINQPRISYSSDLDGDGDWDILVGAGSSNNLSWFENDGAGNFSAPVQIENLLIWVSSIHTADVDNDNDQDILITVDMDNKIMLYENDGNGVFTENCKISSYTDYPSDISTADLDGDGDLDALIATRAQPDSNNFKWYENLLNEDLTVIKGRAFVDMNSNEKYESYFDAVLPGYAINIQPNGTTLHTDANGNYYYETVTPGNYSAHITDPMFFACNAPALGELVSPETVPFEFSYQSFQCIEQDFVYRVQSTSCRILSGQVFYDSDADATFDQDEEGRAGVIVVTNGHGHTITGADGRFSLAVPRFVPVTVGLDLDNSLTNVYCDVSDLPLSQTYLLNGASYEITAGSDDIDTLLFGVYNEEFLLFDAGIYTLVMQNGNVPGKRFHGWMDFKTIGNITEACTLRLEHDPAVEMLNSSIPPLFTGPDFVEWVFPVGTAPERYCMEMDWVVDSVVLEGDTLRWLASYSCPPSIDACEANNFKHSEVVVQHPTGRNAEETAYLYSVRPQGVMPEFITREDNVLSYIIHFKNPLSVTAENVVIVDQLPDELDASTITYPFSSFPDFNYTISEDGELAFNFEGIDLASAEEDELNSYGFVQFNIRLKEDLPDGTNIANKAIVHFNAVNPSETNEVIHRLASPPTAVHEFLLDDHTINIYPNPFSDQAITKIDPPPSFQYDVKIHSIIGHEVRSYTGLTIDQLLIERGSLMPGLYLLSIYQSKSKKFILGRKMIIE